MFSPHGKEVKYHMWELIDISAGRIVKFFLFYKNVKFNNITRKESGVREWKKLVVDPNEKRIWLRKVGKELEEWVSCEDEVMSHKPLRAAWAEAVKIKRNKEIAASCSKLVPSQEIILEK